MPKQKTKRSATKRLKMSATGKVMRTQAGKRHLNSCKTRKRKRNLRGTKVVNETMHATASRMLSTY
ncbi:MAG: 50S ribosomal protein L35 [Kiritimatiellia bacterium]